MEDEEIKDDYAGGDVEMVEPESSSGKPFVSNQARVQQTMWQDNSAAFNGKGVLQSFESETDDAEDAESNSDEELPDIGQPTSNLELANKSKQLGNEFFKKGDYQKAHEKYSEAIAKAEKEAAFYGNRAACSMMLKKFKDAIVDAKKAIELDPCLHNAHVRLVRATLALGDTIACQSAIGIIEANKLGVNITDEKTKLAFLQKTQKEIQRTESSGDFRKVLFLVDRAREVAYGDVMLKVKRAEVLGFLNRYVEAHEECTSILQSDGMVMEAVTLRALCFYQADNLDKALQYYKHALQLAPDNSTVSSMYRRVKSIKELREDAAKNYNARSWSSAYDAYHQCLKLATEKPENKLIASKLNFNLALASNNIEAQKESTLKFLNAALELNPNYTKALFKRAEVYMNTEKYDEAVRDYEAVEKMEPHYADLRDKKQAAIIAAKRAKRKDYYKILGVQRNATADDIKKAYRKRALVHHPDRHASASETERRDHEQKFKEVLEAYEKLTDDKARRRHDLGMDDNDSYAPSHHDFDSTLYQFFYPAGMGSRSGFSQFHRSSPGFSGFRN